MEVRAITELVFMLLLFIFQAIYSSAQTSSNAEEIAKRVELYKFRVPEEFYDWKEDPDGLNNLADDPAYAAELKKFRNKMLEMMQQYDSFEDWPWPLVYRQIDEVRKPGSIVSSNRIRSCAEC